MSCAGYPASQLRKNRALPCKAGLPLIWKPPPQLAKTPVRTCGWRRPASLRQVEIEGHACGLRMQSIARKRVGGVVVSTTAEDEGGKIAADAGERASARGRSSLEGAWVCLTVGPSQEVS